MKHCPRCKETKPKDQFHRNRRMHDGLAWICKQCYLEYQKKWVERRATTGLLSKRYVSGATTKVCGHCEVEKPLSEFHRHTKSTSGTQSYCKSCVKKMDAVRWKNADGSTRENRIAAARKNYEKHGHRYKAAAHLKKYGIPVEERERLIEQQQGKCAACGDELQPRTRHGKVAKYSWRGELDHCHETGKIRGVLCVYCNTALGSLRDDIRRIEGILRYTQVYV